MLNFGSKCNRVMIRLIKLVAEHGVWGGRGQGQGVGGSGKWAKETQLPFTLNLNPQIFGAKIKPSA